MAAIDGLQLAYDIFNKKDKKDKGDKKDKNEQRHKKLANDAVKELEKTDDRAKDDRFQDDKILAKVQDYKTLRKEKEKQAKDIEKSYTGKLHQNKDDKKKNVKLTVHFEKDAAKDAEDGDLDFKVKIAPNQVIQIGSISTRNTLHLNTNFNPPQYIELPRYTIRSMRWTNPLNTNIIHQPTRGDSMNVILGLIKNPNMLVTGGSATNDNSIWEIRDLMQYVTGIHPWNAGHLLNADLGGSGQDDRNLVPLTTSANGVHKGLEAVVKNACQSNFRDWNNRVRTNFQRNLQNYINTGDYFTGVYYEVVASPQGYLADQQNLNNAIQSVRNRPFLANQQQLLASLQNPNPPQGCEQAQATADAGDATVREAKTDWNIS